MKVLVLHLTEKGVLPKLSPDQGQALKKGISQAQSDNPGVTYLGTEFDPATGVGVCSWDAPGPRVVEGIFKKLGVPYDKVVAVQKLAL